MSIQNSALLVQLSVKGWAARKLDGDVNREIATMKGVSSDVGRYSKSLLPGQNLLAAVTAAESATRAYVRKYTLPWGAEGVTLLPLKDTNYIDFMRGYAMHKKKWQDAVDAFVVEYPRLLNIAANQLGVLYRHDDYPLQSEVQNRFVMELTVLPVPDTDIRVALQAEEIEEVKRSVERSLQESQRTAVRALWTRLYERVQALADKLNDPASIFRNSLIENLKEQCDLVASMNFTDDPELEKIRQEVLSDLANHNPDTLRLDPEVRGAVAEKATEISGKLKHFMGS